MLNCVVFLGALAYLGPFMGSSPSDNEGYLPAFRHRDFRLYWFSQFVSHCGVWMQIMAQSWALYDITGSAIGVGLNGLFRAAPSFGLGFFGGAFADRYERKRIVLVATSIQAFLSFILACLAFTDNLTAWSIYLVTMANATVQAVGSPAQSAMLPSLIPRSALGNAVAMNSILFRGSALIGPALGGIIISTWGIGGAYTANSLSSLAVVFALPFIRITSVGNAGRTQLLRSIVEGLDYVRHQPVICGALLLEAFASFFSLNQVFLTIFAKDVLRVGASGFGLMQSARGIGSITGAIALVLMGNFRHPGRTLYILGTIHVLTYLLFSYSRVWPLSLLLLLILGISDTMWGTTRNVIFQYSSTEGMRGRVMSISQMTFRGLNHLGQAPTGIFIALLGGRLAVFSAGLVIGGSMLWTNFLYPGLKRFVLHQGVTESPTERKERPVEKGKV